MSRKLSPAIRRQLLLEAKRLVKPGQTFVDNSGIGVIVSRSDNGVRVKMDDGRMVRVPFGQIVCG